MKSVDIHASISPAIIRHKMTDYNKQGNNYASIIQICNTLITTHSINSPHHFMHINNLTLYSTL